jgi:hypothetical protein
MQIRDMARTCSFGFARQKTSFSAFCKEPARSGLGRSPAARSELEGTPAFPRIWIEIKVSAQMRRQDSYCGHPRRCPALVLAEGAGFEPAIRLPVYTLSRRAPSTTRPPLRSMRRPGARLGGPGVGNLLNGRRRCKPRGLRRRMPLPRGDDRRQSTPTPRGRIACTQPAAG